MSIPLILVIFFFLVFLGGLVFFFSRYKRCPPDKILVVYGKTGGGRSSICIHGGACFVWPLVQSYGWLDLTPFPVDLDLRLIDPSSEEDVRVQVPSTWTIGISTKSGIMENAAERLLGQNLKQVRQLAEDLISSKMRTVSMPIGVEIINSVEAELAKVGLRLINLNLKDEPR